MRNSEAWKWIKLAIEIALIVAIVFAFSWVYSSMGFAGSEELYTELYVLCADYLNVRMTPNKKLDPIGWLETGDKVYTDGRKKNGYIHLVDLAFEDSEGWVYAGYLVEEEPERLYQPATIVSKGRLAARKYINGKRTRWLKPLATLIVYYWTDEWSLTNCGYVQSKYLELEGV